MEYDEIIVGAGSSGATLAARLSEDRGRAVLLLEAGPDFATVELTPANLLRQQSVGAAEFDWGYTGTVRGRAVAVPRGKVVGGSSAVNGAIALRGTPADYDEWASLGNDRWSWADVLPYFRRLEDDQDEGGDFHGRGGPLPICRVGSEALHPIQAAFVDACLGLGFAPCADMNHPEASGVGPWPMNRRDDVRVSAAIAYLLGARGRLNLTIRSGAHIHRVLFEGIRAVGVEADCGGQVQRVYGRRVTLAAGAFASPAILLRSGIGPAPRLAQLGIPLVVDLPGVGANLVDHPQIGVTFQARPGVLDGTALMMQAALRCTAPGSAETNDLQLCVFQFPEDGTVRVSAVLQRPHSRGSVTLASTDPHDPPRIDLNLADDVEDARRLAEGVRLIWAIAGSPAFAALVEDEITLDDGVRLPLAEARATLATDGALADYIARAVSQFYHPVGTCRMGPDGDAGAVVDARLRVRGVEGVRVVDASVMPTIPRANTNLTCIMVAERAADWLRETP